MKNEEHNGCAGCGGTLDRTDPPKYCRRCYYYATQTRFDLGECPLCDERVYTEKKFVVAEGEYLHKSCYDLLVQWQWAMANPLI